MKTLIALSLTIFSFSLFADVTCTTRFDANLAVTVRMKNHMNPAGGSIIWDDANTCGRENNEWICTEIYPGAFKVTFKDLTPSGNVGAVQFKVKAIARKDDLGNRYSPGSLFGNFVKTARFQSIVIPQPTVSLTWKKKEYQMVCSTVE